jgi:hypothetical protein
MDLIIVIPIHKVLNQLEEKVLTHNINKIKKGTETCVLCPKLINSYFEIKFPNIKLVNNFSKYQKTLRGYNKLLLSVELYEYFIEYDYILICQSDVFIKDLCYLEKFIASNAAYSGALFEANCDMVIGNGGFSLRRVSEFLRILKTQDFSVPKVYFNTFSWNIIRIFERYFPLLKNIYLNGRVNEDVVWSLFTPASFIKINSIGDIVFAVEKFYYESNNISDVKTIAFHAWEKYLPAKMQNEIFEIVEHE